MGWSVASSRAFIEACGAVALVGCSASADPTIAATGSAEQRFINGSDDRRQYFEVLADGERAAFEEFAVALMPRSTSELLELGAVSQVPTWGEANGLCDDEPFAEEPAAAFCSGVLVDWDLVLTSGHCVDFLPLESYRVVFGYYYAAPGELAVSPADVYEPAEVLLARADGQNPGERLDFAWLRLRERVRLPHRPAAVNTAPPGPALGAPVISIGAGGGAPLKLDAGGRVRNVRPGIDDYFVADTDTSEGSSGGGIFDADLALLGTLARGAPDYVETGAGCRVTARESDPALAREQFTFVHRAVEALCAMDASRALCDPSCEQPCASAARPPDPPERADEGCTLSPTATSSGGSGKLARAGAALVLALLASTERRRRSARCAPRT